MRYLEQLLWPDEQLEVVARKHWILFLGPAFLFLVGAVAYAWQAPIVFTLGFALGVIALMYASISYATSAIGSTDRRLLARSGLVARRHIDREYGQIEAIRVEQGPLGQALDFGTVVVRDAEGKETRLVRIAAPTRFVGAVSERIQSASV